MKQYSGIVWTYAECKGRRPAEIKTLKLWELHMQVCSQAQWKAWYYSENQFSRLGFAAMLNNIHPVSSTSRWACQCKTKQGNLFRNSFEFVISWPLRFLQVHWNLQLNKHTYICFICLKRAREFRIKNNNNNVFSLVFFRICSVF